MGELYFEVGVMFREVIVHYITDKNKKCIFFGFKARWDIHNTVAWPTNWL